MKSSTRWPTRLKATGSLGLGGVTLDPGESSQRQLGSGAIAGIAAGEEVLVLGIDHHRLGRVRGLADDAGRLGKRLLVGEALGGDSSQLVERLDILSHLSTPGRHAGDGRQGQNEHHACRGGSPPR